MITWWNNFQNSVFTSSQPSSVLYKACALESYGPFQRLAAFVFFFTTSALTLTKKQEQVRLPQPSKTNHVSIL